MAKIREDLIGVVYVGEHSLYAGDTVPDGAVISDDLLAAESVSEPVEAEQEPAEEASEPEAPKRKPRTAAKPKE